MKLALWAISPGGWIKSLRRAYSEIAFLKPLVTDSQESLILPRRGSYDTGLRETRIRTVELVRGPRRNIVETGLVDDCHLHLLPSGVVKVSSSDIEQVMTVLSALPTRFRYPVQRVYRTIAGRFCRLRTAIQGTRL